MSFDLRQECRSIDRQSHGDARRKNILVWDLETVDHNPNPIDKNYSFHYSKGVQVTRYYGKFQDTTVAAEDAKLETNLQRISIEVRRRRGIFKRVDAR